MGEWVEWKGGPRPMGGDAMVEVQLRNGDKGGPYSARTYYWAHGGADGDIVAYRLVCEKRTDGWKNHKGGGCPKAAIGKRVEVRFRSGTTKETVGDAASGLWNQYGSADWRIQTPYDIVAYRIIASGPDAISEPNPRAKWFKGEMPTTGTATQPTAPANSNHNHAAALNLFAADCHAASRRAGWYTDPHTGKALERNVPEMMMLTVSEIAEAMEGYRKSTPAAPRMDDHLPHRKSVEVELADALIRIGDLATYLGLDLGGAVVEKMKYNSVREDHKLEARRAAGGKGF